jgi:hypothetical protein
MKGLIVLLVLVAVSTLAWAQAPPPAAPAGQKTLAATVGLYVFPAKGQTPEKQSQEEAECYNWAVQNTGTDPFQLGKQAEAQKAQTEQAKQQAANAGAGAGAKGAVAGAAAGALIGEVGSGNASKGAAYGAAAGAIAGRRKKEKAQAQATAQVEQQGQAAQQATQQQLDGFKKAFSVCLESKNYMVKF